MPNLNSQVANATKWSVVTEVMAKLVTPISNMVLARLLTPEAFGVVATLTMIIAFAEIFTDAGFQKYLIQKQFIDDDDRDKDTNVAFWSNLVMSLVLWGVIAIFSDSLATLVGSPGLGFVLIVSCAAIPIAAFSSIQMALFRKDLDFKTLFYRRLVSVIVPLCVTVPLAFWLRSYWALVIGTVATNLSNAIVLTIKSNWSPRIYYSFSRLRKMFSYTAWAIVDAILIWATNYADIFFIGLMLSDYYLGLYRTSMGTVGAITSVITASILPVVMPALSKAKSDNNTLRAMLLQLQKYTSIILLPIGFGIFAFRDLITAILLGDQWGEAAPFIGLWGLMDVIVVIFARFGSNLYPAIGKPKLSVLAQVLHLIVVIPAVVISIRYGFTALYWTRSIVRLEAVLVNLILIYYCIQLRPWRMILNLLPEFIGCIIMMMFSLALLSFSNGYVISFIWILLASAVYFATLWLFPAERVVLVQLWMKIRESIPKPKFFHK